MHSSPGKQTAAQMWDYGQNGGNERQAEGFEGSVTGARCIQQGEDSEDEIRDPVYMVYTSVQAPSRRA